MTFYSLPSRHSAHARQASRSSSGVGRFETAPIIGTTFEAQRSRDIILRHERTPSGSSSEILTRRYSLRNGLSAVSRARGSFDIGGPPQRSLVLCFRPLASFTITQSSTDHAANVIARVFNIELDIRRGGPAGERWRQLINRANEARPGNHASVNSLNHRTPPFEFPVAFEPGQVTTANTRRRVHEGGVMTMAYARRRARDDVRTPTKFVAKISEVEAKQSLTCVLLRFTAKELADASGSSVDAAKLWKQGLRFPHGHALINLCRALSPIDDWWIAETRAPVSLGTDQDQNIAHAFMQQQASMPGPEGDAARAYLRVWRRG